MSEFVVCAACGARIRAGRRWCLRCDERLVAAAPPPSGLNVSGSGSLGIAAAAALSLLVPVAALMSPKSSAGDEIAQPARPRAPSTMSTRLNGPTESRAGVGTPAVPPPVPVAALAPTAPTMMMITTPAAHDLQTAKLRYQRALLDKPDDAEALNELGLVLIRLGQPDNAVARFRRATEIAANKWIYHFDLAYALGRLKQWDEAVAEYRAAARLSPDDYATQYNLAMALQEKGDDPAAIPEFRRAITRAPGEAGAYLSLGISLEKTGDIDDAQRQYRQYLQMAPDAPEAPRLKAHLQTLGSGPLPPQSAPATSSP